jgi:hypothetical protein
MIKEIHNDIISQLLVDACGWVSVDLSESYEDYQSIPLKVWADTNCHGKFKHTDSKFLFEHAEDAVIFKLRWV